MNKKEKVILVDESDREIGFEEKIEAHRRGLLHRAFSVFIFNSRGELLLQKRAEGKYHSAGLWTNTACGHPRPGEELASAAERRLREEMGINCKLKDVSTFIYQVPFGNGLIEHELDHVFIGRTDDLPMPDPTEAGDWRHVSWTDLEKAVALNPEAYTFWFRIILERGIIKGI